MQDINFFKNQILTLMQLSRNMPSIPVLEIFNNRNFLISQVLSNYHKNFSQSEMAKKINQAANPPIPTELSPLVVKIDPFAKFEEEIPSFDRTRSAETCITKSEANYDQPSSPYSIPSPVDEKKEVKEEPEENTNIAFSSEPLLVKLEPEEEAFSAPVLEENKVNDVEPQQEEAQGLLKQSKKIIKEKIGLKNPKTNKMSPNSSEDNNKEGALESKEKTKKARAKKEFWKEEEDTKLMELLEVYGPKWTKIGRQIGGKSGKQTRDRYMNTLRPGINHEDWTEDEEKLLASLLKIHGKKWCKIASNMPGRTENQVKNKYYCVANKKTGKVNNPFVEFEDEPYVENKHDDVDDDDDDDEEEEDRKIQQTIMADRSLLKSLPLNLQEGLLQISKAF